MPRQRHLDWLCCFNRHRTKKISRMHTCSYHTYIHRYMQTGRQTGRQAGRQTERETDIQTYSQIDGGRQADGCTDR